MINTCTCFLYCDQPLPFLLRTLATHVCNDIDTIKRCKSTWRWCHFVLFIMVVGCHLSLTADLEVIITTVHAHCKKKQVVLTHFSYLNFMLFNIIGQQSILLWHLLMFWNAKQAVGLHCIQWFRRGRKLKQPFLFYSDHPYIIFELC